MQTLFGLVVVIGAVFATPYSEASAASADYRCDGNADLHIALYGDRGRDDYVRVAIRNYDFCQTQAENLQFLRSDVYDDAQVAVCNMQLDLEVFALTSDGDIRPLGTRRIGDDQHCLAEARRINTRETDPGEGRRAVARYVCSSQGHLMIELQSELTSRDSVLIHNPSFCRMQARELNAVARVVTHDRRIAVCNYQLDMEVMLLRPNGLIRSLGKRQIGNDQECLRAAARINRTSRQ